MKKILDAKDLLEKNKIMLLSLAEKIDYEVYFQYKSVCYYTILKAFYGKVEQQEASLCCRQYVPI